MTAPSAALRGQDPDRWARRAAIGFSIAMVAGLFVPVHRAAMLTLAAVMRGPLPGEWNWPWEWAPLVVPRFLGVVLAPPLIGLLAFAAAARRRRGGFAREALACGVALAVAWGALALSTPPVRGWAEDAWDAVLPPVAFVFVWAGARLRRRHPLASSPRLLCLLGSLGILAYVTLPVFGREPFLGARATRPYVDWARAVLATGGTFALAGLVSTVARETWPLAHTLTRALGWAVAVWVPVGVVLAMRRIMNIASVPSAPWSLATDQAWVLLAVRNVLLCTGALGLGSAGLAAFLDARLSRAASRSERAELEGVFG